MSLEFSDSSTALEKNPTEPVYTYMGLYYKAHPEWAGWSIVQSTLEKCKGNMKWASSVLYKNQELTELVYGYYKRRFWDLARLDEVQNQNTADEIMIFGVNVGMIKAIKTAQKLVGVKEDGRVGKETLNALNTFDSEKFDEDFDKLEIAYYDALVEKNPERKIYAKGWRSRAEAV